MGIGCSWPSPCVSGPEQTNLDKGAAVANSRGAMSDFGAVVRPGRMG